MIKRALLILPNGYSCAGGIAQYNRDFIYALRKSNEFDEIFILPRKVIGECSELPPGITQKKMPNNILLFSILSIYHALKLQPSLLVCGHLNFIKLTNILNSFCNAKYILQIHGIEAWTNTNKINKTILKKLDLVFSVSRYTRNKFLNWSLYNKFSVKVVSCAMDKNRLDNTVSVDLNLRKKHGLDNKKVLLTVGRLSSLEGYKGHDKIIKLMPKLIQIEELVYLIIGSGDDLPRLESLVQSLGLTKNVQFLTDISNQYIGSYFELADAFAMPSTGEGFGIVFLEAATRGLPVLGGSIDGSYDALLEGELGIAVNPNNMESLLEKLTQLIQKPKENKEYLLDGFSLPVYSNQIIGHISQLMNYKDLK